MPNDDARAHATSWAIACEIARRTDSLTLRETHPGGGLYDCLTFHDGSDALIQINRVGSVHVGDESILTYDEWRSTDRGDGAKRTAQVLLERAGMSAPQQANATTRTTLTFRIIAELVGSSLDLNAPLSVRSALYDGSDSRHVDDVALGDVSRLRPAPPEGVWVVRDQHNV